MKAGALIVLASLALTACQKTEPPPAPAKAAEEVPAKKKKNIMRFEDTPKPPASAHAGEL